MDQLWAPWRMSYIEQAEPESGCLFCNAARETDKDEQNYVVHRGSKGFVLLNRYPYNSGHLMVAPYQHTGQLEAIYPDTGRDLFATTQLAVRVLEQAMHPDGFNIGVNQGKVAGAGIADHIHLHIVPRWDGDTNFMPVLANVKVIPEMLSATAQKIRPLFREMIEAQ